ncbi:hypothetical protein LCGC14_2296440 [marine sediment metagenome]|uniref:argininosuccinate synthase n=1 Tax=marine sediment metagenome TaxID=412755 RepID=A0A0F9CQA2_9ZZZZ
MEKGNCKHGKFDLMEGCPQCTADRMAKEGNTEASIAEAVKANQRQIVKVQYYSQTTGEISDREYTYYSIDRLQVGDIVQVPVRDTVAKAKVSAIDVSAAEIAAFADKVKTIPGCSVIPPEPEPASIPYVMPEEMRGVKISSNAARLVDDIAEKLTEPEADAKDTTINLCDTCMNRMDYPNCLPSGEVSAEDVVEYGDGLGNDNIIKCPNHKPETAVALRPGEDIEAQGYHKEAVKALKYAEMVYYGQWFCNLRLALDAFVDVTQQNVSGTVRVKLFKGRCSLAGVKSKKSLYRPDLASFTMGAEYDPTDAIGFIKLFGLPMKVAGIVDGKHRKKTPKGRKKK